MTIKIAEACLETLARYIESWGYTPDSEAELAHAISQCLKLGSYTVLPEHVLSDESRVDIFLPLEGIAVELKVKGSVNEITRQLMRYASADQVDGLLLVTTKRTHSAMPKRLNGKPLRVLVVGGL